MRFCWANCSMSEQMSIFFDANSMRITNDRSFAFSFVFFVRVSSGERKVIEAGLVFLKFSGELIFRFCWARSCVRKFSMSEVLSWKVLWAMIFFTLLFCVISGRAFMWSMSEWLRKMVSILLIAFDLRNGFMILFAGSEIVIEPVSKM